MAEDPHALKLYIDGNAYNNPGGAGGFACVAEYPDSWERNSEVIFSKGFHETTNNRMELQACIAALQYIADKGRTLGVERVLIVTDSHYVYEGQMSAQYWRAQHWKNARLWPKQTIRIYRPALNRKRTARFTSMYSTIRARSSRISAQRTCRRN